MPLFTLTGRDRPDGFALRAATRDTHLAYLAAAGERVRLGGPWLDGEGRSIGSLVILEADDVAEAEAFAQADPYARAGLFAETRVEPWKLVVGAFARSPG